MRKKMYLAFVTLCGSLIYFGCSQDTTEFDWQQIESGTNTHLYGVHFVDAKRGWAVAPPGRSYLLPMAERLGQRPPFLKIH